MGRFPYHGRFTRPRGVIAALVAIVALLPVAACGRDETPTPSPTPDPGESSVDTTTVTLTVDGRPFRLFVPSSYDEDVPVPLVIGLHGYTSHSAELESYFRVIPHAQRHGFLYALPDGTTDRRGDQFWNATNACCDLFESGVDDSTYLSDLIEFVKSSYAVDGDRVFLIGHSNGGYMSHRMACDHADQITAIASLAGVVWANPSRCHPARPVSVLQIHGTADETVNYRGGVFAAGRSYPGAEATVAQWRELNGCSDAVDTSRPPLDLDHAVIEAETVVSVYADGCRDGTRVELWSMEGSRHVPVLSDAFTAAVLDFFAAAAART
jgi:polyhydroxybutyrate depolymerase